MACRQGSYKWGKSAFNITSAFRPIHTSYRLLLMPPKLDTKVVFITFPQNDTLPEVCLERIVSVETPHSLQWAVVAREQHLDGNNHLHCLLVFAERRRVLLNHFDYIATKHGNYQSARSVRRTLAYVMKKGAFVAHGIDPVKFLKEQEKGPKLCDEVAGRLMQGATAVDLLGTHPGFVLMHARKIVDFQSLLHSKTLAAEIPCVTGTIIAELPSTAFRQDFGPTIVRGFRTPGIWIYGPTGLGKTTFVRMLSETFRGYQIPYNNDHSLWDDNNYDFSYCDEFKGQLTMTFLNEWIQGSVMHLNTKGGSKVKRKNVLTIILSNFSPMDCYKNAINIDPLLGRLHLLEFRAGEKVCEFLKLETFPINPARESEDAETQLPQ